MRLHDLLWPAAGLLLLTGCVPLILTPEDFPEPPLTPIVEFPTLPPASPTPRPMLKPIFEEDMIEARTTFLIIQTAMAAGDSSSIAERCVYPIQVKLDGRPIMINSSTELEANHEGVFTRAFLDALSGANSDDLMQMPDGVKAANGALWLNHFCADSACTQGQWLVTQINN